MTHLKLKCETNRVTGNFKANINLAFLQENAQDKPAYTQNTKVTELTQHHISEISKCHTISVF